MQDVASWKDSLVEDESVQAIDIRDNKTYWVTKLKDGHVWMTQNLDFDILADAQDPTKMKTLTSENTDLTDRSRTGAYSGGNGYSYDEDTGIISWTPASSARTINFEGTTVTDWQNSNTAPYSASKTDDTNTGHASLGNYYNWTAAIASNNSGTLTSNTLNDISQNPKNSICPKGWRLPTISSQSGSAIGSTNEFARLNYLYNNNLTNTNAGLIIEPLWFLHSGYINTSNKLADFNIEGTYWSSTSSDSHTAYYLSLRNGSVNPSYNYNNTKLYGFPIRCLAR